VTSELACDAANRDASSVLCFYDKSGDDWQEQHWQCTRDQVHRAGFVLAAFDARPAHPDDQPMPEGRNLVKKLLTSKYWKLAATLTSCSVRLVLSVSAPSETHSRLGTTLVTSSGSDLQVYDPKTFLLPFMPKHGHWAQEHKL
jgi:hypothetical protein